VPWVIDTLKKKVHLEEGDFETDGLAMGDVYMGGRDAGGKTEVNHADADSWFSTLAPGRRARWASMDS